MEDSTKGFVCMCVSVCVSECERECVGERERCVTAGLCEDQNDHFICLHAI